MLYHYKYVEDAIRDCLAAGFNAQIAEAAGVYNFEPFAINFEESSTNFAMTYVDPEGVEKSPLMEFPGMAVYTDQSADASPTLIHGIRFSGQVMACVDVYVLSRDGREGFRPDAQLSAAEGAILDLFQSYIWPVNQQVTVSYRRQVTGNKSRNIPLADGHAQRLNVRAQFGVRIN